MSTPNNSHQPDQLPPSPSIPKHRATYTKSKTTGEYLIRIVGPDAVHATGETIPVSTKSGDIHMETLGELVSQGIDDWIGPGYEPSGQPFALYRFDRKPREKKPFKM